MSTDQHSSPPIAESIARVVASRPVTWLYLNVFPYIDRLLLRLTRGRLSVTIGQPMGLLTSIGAKSGQRRTTPLLYTVDGANIILIASYGGQPRHPAWYYNLRAHPEVTFLRAGHERTYIAREAAGNEREALWHKAAARYPGYNIYQERTGQRQIPVFLLTPKA
ncbi:MAG TPA: nitroreductase family deazaflavin-dependent oxidoreductase [Herpetosiphonaceae bacterium]